MASEVKANKLSPATSTTVTLGGASDVFQLPASAEIDIASGATLDVNGTIDLTGATTTGFPGLFASYAIICDQKTAGTEGGTFTSGAWRTRDLNTEITDPDGIVSISTNQFTLAAGSYLIQWSAPCYEGNRHKTRLYDVTGTAVIQYGSSEMAYTAADETRGFGYARVTPSGSNAYIIEHQCESTKATNGLGLQAGFSVVEMYTMVEIFKEA